MSRIDELKTLLADSALAAIHRDAPLTEIEEALRALTELASQSDPIRRAILREATFRRLRMAGVGSPLALTEAVFGNPAKRFSAMEQESVLHLSTAEPWPEAVKGSELLDQMAATFSRFLFLSAEAADAEALWCLNTYAYDTAGVLPNLCIRSGEKRCGKTRNLEILACLVQRPLHTAQITPAALFRTIDRHHPTLLIDEADTIFVNGRNTELRGLFNAGLYRSNAFVLRCGNRREPQLCSVWCPKAIALIGRLPETLEDRSIIISMRRKNKSLETFRYDPPARAIGASAAEAGAMGAGQRTETGRCDAAVTRDSRPGARYLAPAPGNCRCCRRRLGPSGRGQQL
jgi:hypothetical protein